MNDFDNDHADDLLQSLGGVTAVDTADVEKDLWDKVRDTRISIHLPGRSLLRSCFT